MKSFFEEYGFMLVAIIVIVALITIIGDGTSGVSKAIGDSSETLVTNFVTKAEQVTNKVVGE